jgi:hypothetical protein
MHTFKGKRDIRDSKVRYVRAVRTAGVKGTKVEARTYRFRMTLAQQRRFNIGGYVYSLGRAMVWPALPGTHFADDIKRWDAEDC